MKLFILFLFSSPILLAMQSDVEIQARQKIYHFLIRHKKCNDEGTAAVFAGELQLQIKNQKAHMDISKTRYIVDLTDMEVTTVLLCE